MTESLVLAVAGGGAGLVVAFAGVKVILALAFRHAHYVPISALPSLPVLGFAFGVALTNRLLVWDRAGVDCDEGESGGSAAWRESNDA